MTYSTTRRRVRLGAVALAAAVALAPMAIAAPAQAAVGGPLILMGIDAEDGGIGGHGPIATYAEVAQSVLNQTSNGGDGILVIGANNSFVTGFWDEVGTRTGETVTFVPGSDIDTVSFTGYQMIGVAGSAPDTFGGLTASDNVQLTGRKADIADFVNTGGGLLGFLSNFTDAQGGSYGYLGDVGAFTFDFPSQFSNITPTAEGEAVGITDALDVCCWHAEFATFPPFLNVLATNASSGNAVAVGGAGVVISDIQLAPLTQTHDTGDTASVTATVLEDGAPVSGTTVTFTVTGPNATTGTATTDSSGQAVFTYSGSTVGTDNVQASYVPSTGGSQSSNLVDVVWLDGNDAPTASAGGPYTGVEGSPVSLTGSASDPDAGDTLTLTWSYTAGPGVDLGASCVFGTPNTTSTMFTCDDDGAYDVTLSADDGTEATDSDPATVTVANAAPEITSVGVSSSDPIAVNTSIDVSAPFTDAGGNDTHTCSIDWGDGAPSAGSVAAGECTGSHSYAAAGLYTVAVTVTDDDLGADTESFQYVVVYDPGAGFVTGGGKFASPVGSYAAEPGLGGRANVGFVAKYKKGRAIPDGQTQFQLHGSGFNFHSTSYDWLVVASPTAHYKGSGTVDGSGDYGFLLSVRDAKAAGGGVDTFRMKIWDKSSGDVIYDTQMGAADGAEPSTPMSGGNVVIHAKK